MKKAIALLLLLAMFLSLTACGADRKYAPLLASLEDGNYEGVKRELSALSPEFQEEQDRLLANDALLERYGEALARLAPEAARNTGAAAETPQADKTAEMPPVAADSGWNERKLSDGELDALVNAAPLAMREQISTVADAKALLDKKYQALADDTSISGENSSYLSLMHPASKLAESGDYVISRTDAANILMWLVEDDLPVGIILAVALDGADNIQPFAAANYLRTDAGYVVFDPVPGKQSGCMEVFGEQMQETTAGSLEVYMDQLARSGSRLWKAYCWEGSGCISYYRQDSPRGLEILGPAVSPVYRNPIFDTGTVYADPENIDKYALSQYLGGVTLTAEQARALVGAPAEEVREAVRTAGDMLLYMLAANITNDAGDRIFPETNWHYDLNAIEVLQKGKADDGSFANLANYLLEGDYEEMGFILHAGYPGSGDHVYNYFRQDGKYCIVDFSWYSAANYRTGNDFPVMVCDFLEEYGRRVDEIFGGVCLVISHTSPGQHLPNSFDDANRIYVLPEGAEYTVLYQDSSSSAYHVGEAPLPEGFPDWTKFGS